MTDTTLQLKNPSVTLYAFHLCQDLTQEPGQLRQDADQLWQNCANLSEPLAIPDLKSLPEKIQSHPTQIPTNSYAKLLPGDGRLKPPLQIEGSALTVEVYPLQIHDTYALDLTLCYQNVTAPASQFSHLNPQGCLQASQIRPSLGQTLLLYAEPVGNPQEDRKLADACVDAFLQRTNQQRPFFSASGQLFGSPIFEYDNCEEKPSEQCHILVSFNRHPETLNLAQKTYFSFLNLLCCRSKILFAYHQARWCYRQTRGLYAELEDEVKLFQELPTQPEARLEQLKQKLSQILPKNFEYSHYLRDIGDHQTAIATNVKNYDYWLGKIRESSLEGDRLEFLEDFHQQTCQRFQAQIQADLSYLTPGQQLLEQMLAAIRGIVEIEQTESDRQHLRQLQEKEAADKERDRQRSEAEKELENTIKAVGVGVATGTSTASVTASSFGRIDKSPLNLPFHPLFSSIIFSLLLGLFVGVLSWLLLRINLNKPPKKQS